MLMDDQESWRGETDPGTVTVLEGVTAQASLCSFSTRAPVVLMQTLHMSCGQCVISMAQDVHREGPGHPCVRIRDSVTSTALVAPHG